ncbi:hypothetical protein F8M41_002075 [Gigaspora margarita]|uniref:Serine protease n=1 Tax=Gigaspora margarita TaxID=4874 RepID=A0A8H3XEV7_GIGMA|nr:hypothetical protein F8M41_002075 [Gigaspora margarita]
MSYFVNVAWDEFNICYSIYAEKYHPLAKLWNVDDAEVPELLEDERNLISIDEILRPILEQDDFISSFGGTYINIFENYIAVNTVNSSKVDDLLSLPQINPHKDFLYFIKANNSMSQIQYNFNEISLLANKLVPKLLFIYTDMEINNNVLLIFNQKNPSVLALSRRDVASRDLKVKVLGGDGLLNMNSGPLCSVGFWAKSIDREVFSVVTAGHCYKSGEWSYYPWGSTNLSGILIGPMIFSMNDHYDFGIISLEYENVVPTFSIRNDDATRYKELNITDFDSNFGDSGGSAFSFSSPQSLYSVVVNGIFSVIGAAIQPIDKIFKELDKHDRYYKLYLGK